MTQGKARKRGEWEWDVDKSIQLPELREVVLQPLNQPLSFSSE